MTVPKRGIDRFSSVNKDVEKSVSIQQLTINSAPNQAITYVRLFISLVLGVLFISLPMHAHACTSPNVLQSDGSCLLAVQELNIGVIDFDIDQVIDIDAYPFPITYDWEDQNIFVEGVLPADAVLAMNWNIVPRPAMSELKRRVHGTLAQQLSVPINDVFIQKAHGQITSLLFIRIMQIIQKPADQRDEFEQLVYEEAQAAFRDRRRHVATLASNEYDSWRNNPCGYKIPVGDDPNAYINQTQVVSYCLNSEFGNSLALAFTTTPAIPAENYLYWANIMRMNGFTKYWESFVSPSLDRSAIAKDSYAKAYLNTQEGMAYHQAWGTLSAQPGFDFSEAYSDDPSLASGLQDAIAGFTANYARDFYGSILLSIIVQGFLDGVIPDPHDIAVIATALATYSALEIKSQVESKQGIEDALSQSNQSLVDAISNDKGRSELMLMLIELGMPSLLGYRSALPDSNMPLPGVFYSAQMPGIDEVSVNDWSVDFKEESSLKTNYLFSDQGWLSRNLGGAILTGSPTFEGFTPFVRHIAPNGDFATAWLVRSEDKKHGRFLVTRYAEKLRRNTRGYSIPSDPELKVRVTKRINSDCPAKSTYPFGTNLVDSGMSCVLVEDVSVAFQPSSDDPRRPGFEPALSAGDTVIIAGRVATVERVNITGSNSNLFSFTLAEPLLPGEGQLFNQSVHKVGIYGGSGVRSDRFDHQVYGATNTAIIDFGALPPSIELAQPALTVEANAVFSSVDLGAASANDPTEGTLNVSNDAPDLFPLGSTTVTYTASDSQGNEASALQTVTVVDTTPPQFTSPLEGLFIEATALPMPVSLEIPEANDIFPVTVISDSSGVFPYGGSLVKWTASDSNGNTSITTQFVTIIDTTPPVFTSVPANMTMEASGPLTVPDLGQAEATDLFGLSISNDAPTNGFPLGGDVVTWTAVDENGNQSEAIQLVTVVDTTPPVIVIDSPVMEVEANALLSLVDLGAVSATDLVDGSVVISSDAPDSYPLGITLVTYTAVDARGNAASAVQSVTVVDTTPPVFTVVPADIEAIANGPSTALELGTAAASDIFEVVISNDAPPSFPVGTTVVTWTATDTAGNMVSYEQAVTLKYNYYGFSKPIEEDGIYKSNRVLPLSIGLGFADGSIPTDAIAKLSILQVSEGEVIGEGLEVLTVGGADVGNLFSFRNQAYRFNLATKGMQSGQYRLVVDLDDGERYFIDIALK